MKRVGRFAACSFFLPIYHHKEELPCPPCSLRTFTSWSPATTKTASCKNADIYCEDGFIKSIGTALDISADEVIDGSHMLCYPGLVNTHHHLYQVFSRNLPQVQNMELFDWLKTLYEIWKTWMRM